MMHLKSMKISDEDFQLIHELCRARTRESFFIFRLCIRPDLIIGWWQRELAQQLQIFYEDFVAGKHPRLAILAPPQHGKTTIVNDLCAYVAGRNPDKKIIYASYGDELGLRANSEIQRTISSPQFQELFSGTRIGMPGWQCNQSLVEFVGHTGSFRNTTVNGAVTGFQLHLGVIDDPLKGSREAESKLIRNRNWSWLTNDFMTRFAEDGALLIIMTRWNIDDLLGRLEEQWPDLKVLSYPAIAEADTAFRRCGDPLFPELKSRDFLLRQKKLMSEASWQSLYQQNPIVVGGGVFPINKLLTLNMLDRSKITHSVRYWDKAGTHGDGAFTAGVRMHSMSDGTFVISHVARGQWSALERETNIKTWTEVDAAEFGSYEVYIEQEPGSGGKESAESTIRMLAGFRVYADRVTGAKEIRAEPFAAQVQGGNVGLVAGIWVTDFLDECEVFPAGKWKDQVDAASGAFSKLAAGTAYLTDYSKWV